MNRRRFLGLTAALGATAAAGAACGVPSTSDPQRVGNAPSSGPTPAAPPEPPRVENADTPSDVVQNFLKVTAWANVNGDNSEEQAQAKARARAYLTAETADGWRPGSVLTVGRARVSSAQTDESGTTRVTVVWTSLGKLNDFGAIEQVHQPTTNLTFTVVVVAGLGYRIADVPPAGLLLSDEGLDDFYEQRLIYFWDQSDPNNALLVPDVRYLPKSITEPKRPAEVVGWLRNGPADWLQPAAQALPPEVEVKETSFDGQNRLVVNLSSKAATLDKTALRALAIQLRWSVDPSQRVALRIEGTSTDSSTDDYASYNLALRTDDTEEAERYCTVNHKIRGMGRASSAAILDSTANADVVSAAMPLSKDVIALVRLEGKNPKQRLWVGRSGSPDRGEPVYARTNRMGVRISRPTWLRRPSLLALVACDGRLFAAAPPSAGKAGDIAAVPLDGLPAGVPGPITAVSASPDGHRLALIAGGHVVVVTLVSGPQLDFGPGVLLVKHEVPNPRAVGWSSDARLVIGGSPVAQGGTGLAEVAIDGVGHQWLPPNGKGKSLVVDMVSVRPSSAINIPVLVMFESAGVAWNVFNSDVEQLLLEGPSPSPSGGQPPALASPFFLD